jgi:predicted  nucleic acid-binding Zn-ribbon protein
MLKVMIKKKRITIDDLAIMIQDGFMATAKQEDLLALTERVATLEKEMKGMHGNFDMVFQQLKEIRNEIKEVDTRADVVDLQIRVSKLEKKIKT